MGTEPVTVVVRIKAKPGMEGLVAQELRAILPPTRSEKGCLNFDMHRDPEDPARFLFHENWTSRADLDRHLAAPHITRWIERAEKLLAEPMDLTLWRRVG